MGRGVRQGDPLSPLLFIIYINDVIDPDMTDTEVPGLDSPLSALLLADDVALIERSKTRLRQALQHFSDWATLWGLDIGHSKCGVLPFGAPFGPFRPFLAQDGSIPLITDYKYLGVTFTRDITQIFTTWLQERATKGRQLLKRWRFTLGNSQLTLADRILMFKVIFLPAILYGCKLAGGRGWRSMRILEAIIGRALRIIIGKTPVSTQVNMVLLQREFHVPPVYATAVSRQGTDPKPALGASGARRLALSDRVGVGGVNISALSVQAPALSCIIKANLIRLRTPSDAASSLPDPQKSTTCTGNLGIYGVGPEGCSGSAEKRRSPPSFMECVREVLPGPDSSSPHHFRRFQYDSRPPPLSRLHEELGHCHSLHYVAPTGDPRTFLDIKDPSPVPRRISALDHCLLSAPGLLDFGSVRIPPDMDFGVDHLPIVVMLTARLGPPPPTPTVVSFDVRRLRFFDPSQLIFDEAWEVILSGARTPYMELMDTMRHLA
ncbi:hypothetical protein R1sor_007812 [Riccia sorocarpa]|uniref:Reverse transcriptase domain-containing protein n=1 Tax=Riccia sorocarpa TaxID=122646 RepID=A0ABD3HTP8_9MARC